MDKQTARKIVQHLNHPKIMDALVSYIEYRIEKLKDQLVDAKDHDRVLEFQGAIYELKKVLRLREDALAVDELKE